MLWFRKCYGFIGSCNFNQRGCVWPGFWLILLPTEYCYFYFCHTRPAWMVGLLHLMPSNHCPGALDGMRGGHGIDSWPSYAITANVYKSDDCSSFCLTIGFYASMGWVLLEWCDSEILDDNHVIVKMRYWSIGCWDLYVVQSNYEFLLSQISIYPDVIDVSCC